MDDQQSKINDFVDLVLHNLEKNGFPDNAVSFSLEKMYESASKKGFSFNKVRDILQQKGIMTELTEQHVIFSSPSTHAADFDMSAMASSAQRILQQMTSEQRSQFERTMQDLNPEELEDIKRQWEAMPAEEKTRLMEEMQKFNPGR